MGSILDVFSLIIGGGGVSAWSGVADFPTLPIVEAEDYDWYLLSMVDGGVISRSCEGRDVHRSYGNILQTQVGGIGSRPLYPL